METEVASLVIQAVMMMISMMTSSQKGMCRIRNNSNLPGLRALGYRRHARSPIFISEVSSDLKPSEMIKKLLVNYVRTDPPSLNSTEVKLGVYIISFYSVNEQTMDYSVSMYLRQQWHDPRLAFEQYNVTYGKIRMGDGGWNEIWIPDTFLRNEKGASFHSVTVENRMLEVKSSGLIWYVTKISATLSCPMTLEKFPMDTQVCPMAFESFGYTMDTMYFGPMAIVVQTADDLQLPQFSLINKTDSDCSQNYTTGSYPCLEIKFVLRRDLGYFLIQVYVPSVLIVILSWVSFWINVDASPARVSIGLLTVLTTTTMSSGARSTLPRVSYIKAIDVWMIVCLVFVFTSLIEYAIVNVLARKVGKPARPTNAPPAGPPPPGVMGKRGPPGSCIAMQQQVQRRRAPAVMKCCKGNAPTHPVGTTQEPDGKRKARAVDKLSRKIFPLSFAVFNIIYWVFYFVQPFQEEDLTKN